MKLFFEKLTKAEKATFSGAQFFFLNVAFAFEDEKLWDFDLKLNILKNTLV